MPLLIWDIQKRKNLTLSWGILINKRLIEGPWRELTLALRKLKVIAPAAPTFSQNFGEHGDIKVFYFIFITSFLETIETH